MTIDLNRNCKNPRCGKPLYAESIKSSAKEYCDATCRLIAFALRKMEEKGQV